MDFENLENLELDVREEDRPRVLRRMGILPPFDVIFDERNTKHLWGLGGMLARLCRVYRSIRPRVIGDRCAFEPSCSRYCEYCFETFEFSYALQLSRERLRLCKGDVGGVHLPPEFDIEGNENHG